MLVQVTMRSVTGVLLRCPAPAVPLALPAPPQAASSAPTLAIPPPASILRREQD
jgi:hypothetical protein